MHGHSGKWDSRDITERFGYRYTDAEPTEWAPRMRALTEDTALTHVLFNTCDRDNAQATPTSAPYSSPETHRGARRHRSKFFIGTHMRLGPEGGSPATTPCITFAYSEEENSRCC